MLLVERQNVTAQTFGDGDVGNVGLGQCAHKRNVVTVSTGVGAIKTHLNVAGGSAQQRGKRRLDIDPVVGDIVLHKAHHLRGASGHADLVLALGAVGCGEDQRLDFIASQRYRAGLTDTDCHRWGCCTQALDADEFDLAHTRFGGLADRDRCSGTGRLQLDTDASDINACQAAHKFDLEPPQQIARHRHVACTHAVQRLQCVGELGHQLSIGVIARQADIGRVRAFAEHQGPNVGPGQVQRQLGVLSGRDFVLGGQCDALVDADRQGVRADRQALHSDKAGQAGRGLQAGVFAAGVLLVAHQRQRKVCLAQTQAQRGATAGVHARKGIQVVAPDGQQVHIGFFSTGQDHSGRPAFKTKVTFNAEKVKNIQRNVPTRAHQFAQRSIHAEIDAAVRAREHIQSLGGVVHQRTVGAGLVDGQVQGVSRHRQAGNTHQTDAARSGLQAGPTALSIGLVGQNSQRKADVC